MKRPLLSFALPACLFAVPCAAQPIPATSGNASVDAFIGDVVAKREQNAIARTWSKLETGLGLPNAVPTPSQVVSKLIACSFLSVSKEGLSVHTYLSKWHCPDGDYRLTIDPDWRAPQVTLADFISEARYQEWRSTPMAPPAPPRPPSQPSSSQ